MVYGSFPVYGSEKACSLKPSYLRIKLRAAERSDIGVTLVTPNHTQFIYLVRVFSCDRDLEVSAGPVLDEFSWAETQV